MTLRSNGNNLTSIQSEKDIISERNSLRQVQYLSSDI